MTPKKPENFSFCIAIIHRPSTFGSFFFSLLTFGAAGAAVPCGVSAIGLSDTPLNSLSNNVQWHFEASVKIQTFANI